MSLPPLMEIFCPAGGGVGFGVVGIVMGVFGSGGGKKRGKATTRPGVLRRGETAMWRVSGQLRHTAAS